MGNGKDKHSSGALQAPKNSVGRRIGAAIVIIAMIAVFVFAYAINLPRI
jgi:hypothetical protein